MRPHDITPEEQAEYDEISRIEDLDEWMPAMLRFWDRYYDQE